MEGSRAWARMPMTPPLATRAPPHAERGEAASSSLEPQRLQDILEARVVVEHAEVRVLCGEAEVSRPRLHAMLEGIERARRFADGHPLLGRTLPTVCALEQADPHFHRLAPALVAGKAFDMLGES